MFSGLGFPSTAPAPWTSSTSSVLSGCPVRLCFGLRVKFTYVRFTKRRLTAVLATNLSDITIAKMMQWLYSLQEQWLMMLACFLPQRVSRPFLERRARRDFEAFRAFLLENRHLFHNLDEEISDEHQQVAGNDAVFDMADFD